MKEISYAQGNKNLLVFFKCLFFKDFRSISCLLFPFNHLGWYSIWSIFLIIESCCHSQNKTKQKKCLLLSSATFKKTAEFANNLFSVSIWMYIWSCDLSHLLYQFLGGWVLLAILNISWNILYFSILGMSLYIIKSQSLRKVKSYLHILNSSFHC